MKKLIIFGNGQIAEAVCDLALQISNIKMSAFTVQKSYINSDKLNGFPVYPFESLENYLDIKEYHFVTAMSFKNYNKDRTKIYKLLKDSGINFTNLIHETALCRFDKIGENNIIFEFNNFQKGVEIGNNCIFWSCNHFGHHSKIGNNCFFASHVTVSGGVKILDNNFFGSGSKTIDNIIIGNDSIIGAGTTVRRSLKTKTIVRNKGDIISQIESDKFKL
jgi:sugar O-acyltransferase (sialic acid O-acetyltransferase NeuD family)